MKKWLKNGALFLLALVAAFALIEGLSSVAIFGFDILFNRNPGLNSRTQVRFDDRLGWISIPGYHDPDQYGPGVPLTINAQSFRGSADVADEVPAGRVRVVCSGDSFTFGFGVGDGQDWCDRLADLEPAIDPINMGEAGYGIGQALLKFERYPALNHDLHIFAFVSEDFRRLGLRRYVGWPKPFLTVRNDSLVVEGVPVPRRSPFRPWYAYNAPTFQALRTMQLARRVLLRVGGSSDKAEREAETRIRRTALEVFERVAALDSAKGSRVVFVFLALSVPQSALERDRIRFVQQELAARGLPFVDLATAFRKLPYDELVQLFDPATGHYSARGNEVVAQLLHEQLLANPDIRNVLAPRADSPTRLPVPAAAGS